jgi:hypothetical protein
MARNVTGLFNDVAARVDHWAADLHGARRSVAEAFAYNLAGALGSNDGDAGGDHCKARIEDIHQSLLPSGAKRVKRTPTTIGA